MLVVGVPTPHLCTYHSPLSGERGCRERIKLSSLLLSGYIIGLSDSLVFQIGEPRKSFFFFARNSFLLPEHLERDNSQCHRGSGADKLHWDWQAVGEGLMGQIRPVVHHRVIRYARIIPIF